MELLNGLRKEKDALLGSIEGRGPIGRAIETLVLLLAPFTPHLSEELWEKLGGAGLVLDASWPVFDPSLALEEKAVIVVEINGKVRDKFEAELGLSEDEMKATALGLPRIRTLLGGKPVRKVLCIQNKIVNIDQ